MPLAVTHILIPIILVAIFRDFIIDNNKKKSFSLHYVLIAGLGGIIPDFDIAAYWILYFFGFSFEQVHRTFLHSILIPLVLLCSLLFINKDLSIRRLKLRSIILALSFGIFMHLLLDILFSNPFMVFTPLSTFSIGLNLQSLLPPELMKLAMPSLDAALLIIWIVYLELKHKISDFI